MSQGTGFNYNYLYNEGPSPVTPLLLLGVLLMWVGLPWYFSYEPVLEDVQQQWGFFMLLLPLVILLVLFFFASKAFPESGLLNYVMPASDPASIHRVGGSPVGLALLLILVLVMVWYHSDFMDSWNPFIRS